MSCTIVKDAHACAQHHNVVKLPVACFQLVLGSTMQLHTAPHVHAGRQHCASRRSLR